MSNHQTIRLLDSTSYSGQPWVELASLDTETCPESASSVTLLSANGDALGVGVFDARDPKAAWRRFSLAENAAFDADYVSVAIGAALARRSDENCQRLISSDADYIPGLIVELYQDVIAITAETAAVDALLDVITEVFKEACEPREIVLLNDCPEREVFGLERSVTTLSGNNIKPYWVEIDGIFHRIDLLNTTKPRIYLDQREQHALVGSLCEGRVVLDAFAHSGAFAIQAARSGAEHVVAVDQSESFCKAIGAAAQKNNTFVETVDADVLAFLSEREVGDLDCIILDPPVQAFDASATEALHREAFRCLPEGGVLATYCRCLDASAADFEDAVASAASAAGREARLFARTAQPFDFPVLLNFPQSRHLKGLILQVE